MPDTRPPAERAMAARIAACARWSREDPGPTARRAQAGLRDKFLREVDQVATERGETLTETERQRRADCAYRAHMSRLALRSAKARRSQGAVTP